MRPTLLPPSVTVAPQSARIIPRLSARPVKVRKRVPVRRRASREELHDGGDARGHRGDGQGRGVKRATRGSRGAGRGVCEA